MPLPYRDNPPQGPCIFVTNPIALTLGLLIVGAVVLDGVLYSADHLLFLSRKMFDLIEWMAFWR